MATNSKTILQSEEDSQLIDNLTVIEGVNEALEQWLRESLKVYTFADLAALSAQKIRSRGKQAGLVFSLAELEPILAQAKELADAAQPQSQESPAPAKTKAEKIPAAPEKAKEWNEFATFMVYFERKAEGDREEKRTKVEHRTGIHHMETGEQASWQGVETEQACQWMLKRLGEKEEIASKEVIVHKEEPLKTEAHPVPDLPVPQPTAIEITGIQALQPPSSNQPQDLFMQNRPLTGYVKGNEPLSFTVSFRITGLGASEMAKRNLEFSAVFHTVDLFTSAISRLGSSTPVSLKENEFSYTAELAPLTLSPGTYQLKVLTTIREARPIWAYIEIPSLQVI